MKFKWGKLWVTKLQAAHNLCTQTNKHPRGIYFNSKVMRILQPSEILLSEHFSFGILSRRDKRLLPNPLPCRLFIQPQLKATHEWREVTVPQIFNYELFF